MVAGERVVGPLCRRQGHGSAIHESPRLGLLPLRVQRQQRRELGLGAAVGYDDDLRHQDEESHPVGAVAMASQQQDNGQCEISRILDRRSALRASGCSRQSRVYQLVEVGGLRHQWRVSLRGGAEVEPSDVPGRHVALRRGIPRPARHQVRRAVHEGPRQLAGWLLPELRQLPVSAAAGRRAWTNMQAWYGDTGLLFYNNKDTLNPFLTVRTADSTGLFFDDQWSITKRLTANLGLRFDRMTAKYGVGQDLRVRHCARGHQRTAASPARPGIDRQHLRFQDLGSAARSDLHADGGRPDGRPRLVWPLLPADQRRNACDGSVLTCRFENGRRRSSRSGRGAPSIPTATATIDTLETRNAARRIHGLTPISSETDTDDPSWTLNVADDLKNQYTDQFTLNFERQVARNLAVSASYIYKRAGNLFANLPINEVTGQPWDYERIPFTTSAGQQVMLYSVVFRDYDGDGVLDGEDVGWVGENNTSLVQNMPAFDGVKPKREYQGLQFVLNKRYSERWQGLASVLISNSDGISRRSFRQDFNVEAPMFYDDNWMDNLNYTRQQSRGPAALHAQVRAEALGLLQDPPRRSRSRDPLPDAQRAGGVVARGLSAAHRVRGAAGRRD